MPIILITGVSTGIGRACAELFARDGWKVIGTVRDPERYSGTAWPGEVILERVDLAEPGAGRRLADRVIAAHGVPDVLLNNAGILHFGPVEDEPSHVAEEVFRVNVLEPGFVETAIWDKSVRSRGESPYEGSGPYARAMATMAGFEGSIANRTTPQAAAEEIRAAILDPSDRLRYPVAAYAGALIHARRLIGELRVMRFFHKRGMG